MIKNLLIACSLLISANLSAQLVSYEKIDSFSLADLNQIVDDFGGTGIIVPEYPVDLYRVLYRTEYNDSMTTVSGALAVPQNTVCKAPLVSYQHGTTSTKLNLPSYNSQEKDILLVFASEGKILVAPDMIGLGASTINIHPYIHGFSHAHSTINLLRATREIDENEFDLNLSNQLFLFGYSQGGYSTGVAVKYIEEMYSDEFTVTAAAPMSGPYNLAGAQTDFINSDQPYATPGYLPYLIFGYQSVYGDLYDSISQYFVDPFDTLLYPLFDGHNVGLGTINGLCEPNPVDMFTEEAELAFNTDPNFPLRVRLEENDLLSWTPQTPIKMFYCTQDEQVYYRNAQIADSVWTANGAPNVSSENLDVLATALGGIPDHSGCVAPSLLNGRTFFLEYDNNGIEIIIDYDNLNNTFQVSVLDDDIANYDIEWNDGSDAEILSNIVDGQNYTVELTNKTTGCNNSKEFTKSTVLSIENSLVEPSIDLYPNPANNLLNIVVSSLDNYSLAFINSMGQVVFSRENIYSSEIGVNIEDLPAGVYTAFIVSNERSYSTSFIKQ